MSSHVRDKSKASSRLSAKKNIISKAFWLKSSNSTTSQCSKALNSPTSPSVKLTKWKGNCNFTTKMKEPSRKFNKWKSKNLRTWRKCLTWKSLLRPDSSKLCKWKNCSQNFKSRAKASNPKSRWCQDKTKCLLTKTRTWTSCAKVWKMT